MDKRIRKQERSDKFLFFPLLVKSHQNPSEGQCETLLVFWVQYHFKGNRSIFYKICLSSFSDLNEKLDANLTSVQYEVRASQLSLP